MDFDYRAMTVQHRGRPAVIAFDFIPPRPTTAQLTALCCQDCGCCPYPCRTPNDCVNVPAYQLAAECPAYSRYFLDLYKRTMTGKLHSYQKTCGGLLLMPPLCDLKGAYMNNHTYYFCRRLELKDGPVYVDFDFIPEEPTWAQEMELCVHSCDTCENKCPEIRCTGCNYGAPGETGENCPYWLIGFDEVSSNAQEEAYNRYWLDLHRRTMKGKPVPEGRGRMDRGPVPYVSYPEEN